MTTKPEKKSPFRQTRDCRVCGGDGFLSEPVTHPMKTDNGNTTCPYCNGTGKETAAPKMSACKI